MFELSGHGTVAAGRLVHGVVRSGQQVLIRRCEAVSASAVAFVEFLTRAHQNPSSFALLLKDLTGERPCPGDIVYDHR